MWAKRDCLEQIEMFVAPDVLSQNANRLVAITRAEPWRTKRSNGLSMMDVEALNRRVEALCPLHEISSADFIAERHVDRAGLEEELRVHGA